MRWPKWVRKAAKASGFAVPATSRSAPAKSTVEGKARPRRPGLIIGYAFDRADPGTPIDVAIWVGDRLVTTVRADEGKPSFAPSDAPDCGFTVHCSEHDADWFDQPVTFRTSQGDHFGRDPHMLRQLIGVENAVVTSDQVTVIVQAPPELHRFIHPGVTLDGVRRPYFRQTSESGAMLLAVPIEAGAAAPREVGLQWPTGEFITTAPVPIVRSQPNLLTNGAFRDALRGQPQFWDVDTRSGTLLETDRAAFALAGGAVANHTMVRFRMPAGSPFQTLLRQSFNPTEDGGALELRLLARAARKATLHLVIRCEEQVLEEAISVTEDWSETVRVVQLPASHSPATITVELRGGNPGVLEIAGLGLGEAGFQYEDPLAGHRVLNRELAVLNGDFNHWPHGVVIPFNARRVETARGWFLVSRAAQPSLSARLAQIPNPEGDEGESASSLYGLAITGSLSGNRLRIEGALSKEALAAGRNDVLSLILGPASRHGGTAISRIDVVRRDYYEAGRHWTDTTVGRIAEAVVVPDSPQRIACVIDESARTMLKAAAEAALDQPMQSLLLIAHLNAQDIDLLVADVRLEAREEAAGALTTAEQWEGMASLSADGRTVRGWAVDRGDMGAPALVEIVADAALIASVAADQPHGVLTGAAYRNGNCAFSYELPPQLRDGRQHELSLRIRGADRQLAGAPFTFTIVESGYQVAIDPVTAGVLSGWVTRTGSGEAVSVTLTADGIATTTLADGLRPGLPPCGFAFRLPENVRSLTLSTDEIVLARFGAADSSAPEQALGDLPAPDLAFARKWVDADWYRAAHPFAADPAVHWLEEGGAAGLSPNPGFDERRYRMAHPDVAAAVSSGQLHSGFIHWLASRPAGGERVSRLPSAVIAAEAPVTSDEADNVTSPEVTTTRKAAQLQRLNQQTSIYHRFARQLIEDIGIEQATAAGELTAGLARSEALLATAAFDTAREDQPLISVIMPTYNRATVIADAVRSVLDQSWSNWELLVCDDGSIDKTPLVIKGLADPRIRYLPLQKANGAAARNRGLEFARGEYLAFLDSDNLWHPLFLEAALRTLQDSGAPLLYSGYLDVEMQGSLYCRGELSFRPYDHGDLLQRNYIDLNTLMLRREVYDRLGGFDETLPRVQDWDLVLKYTQAYHPLAMEAYPVLYRRNVAWGQVTEMFVHLNFNDIVRAKAQNRLETGLDLLQSVDRRAVTIVAGPAWLDAHDALAAARTLGQTGDVRLILTDTPAARALAKQVGLTAEILWIAPGKSFAALLWGEGLLLSDSTSALPLDDLPPQLAIAPISRDVDAVSIAGTGRSLPIGGLLMYPVEELAAPERPGTIVVIATPAQVTGWLPLLRNQATTSQPLLLVTVVNESLTAHTSDGKDVSEAPIGERALAATLVHADALIILPGAVDPARGATYGSYAALGSATIVLPEGDAYGAWAEDRLAHFLPESDAGRALSTAVRAHADQAGALRMRRRALARVNDLQRIATVATRLRFALEEMIGRAAA
ncbi:glycosyltransferase family 2 protein [Sphingomonas sp. ID0503]|uniref:glycosyltransferase family 2 protein n=1 Tax=Sphingomonas sp. ID0503 TaxID=3399691 RepID=UPI003AFA649C